MTDDATGLATGRAGGSMVGSYKYVLFLRFILVNLIGAALLSAAAAQGWIGLVTRNDPTRLTLVIYAAFIFGLFLSAWKIVQTSRALRRFDPAALAADFVGRYVSAARQRTANNRAISADALRQCYGMRIAVVRYIANSLVFLGLIGTVIGFIIALSGCPARDGDRTRQRGANGLAAGQGHVGRALYDICGRRIQPLADG